jgi:hypothetical protein
MGAVLAQRGGICQQRCSSGRESCPLLFAIAHLGGEWRASLRLEHPQAALNPPQCCHIRSDLMIEVTNRDYCALKGHAVLTCRCHARGNDHHQGNDQQREKRYYRSEHIAPRVLHSRLNLSPI